MQEPPLQRKRAGSDSFCRDSFTSVKEGLGPGGLRTREELLRVINNILLELEQNYNDVVSEIKREFLAIRKLFEEEEQTLLKNITKSYSVYSKIFANTKDSLEHQLKTVTPKSPDNDAVLRELNGRCMHTVSYSLSKPDLDPRTVLSKFRVLINKKILFLPFPPTDLEVANAEYGTFTLRWKTDPIQDRVVKECGCEKDVKFQVDNREHGAGYPFAGLEFSTEKTLTRHLSGIKPGTAYDLRVRTFCGEGVASEWSPVFQVTTPAWPKWCAWKDCPPSVERELRYTVDGPSRHVATKDGVYGYYSTVLCGSPLPPGVTTKWSVRILETWNGTGDNILVGAAPCDIDQNCSFNYNKSGWYFNCGNMSLYSGPPQCYNSKKVAQFAASSVGKGTVIDVFVDPISRTMSYSLNGVMARNVYTDLPNVALIRPAVLLYFKGDSVELIPG